jgi:hypothetical protein
VINLFYIIASGGFNSIQATGGSITEYQQGGIGYRVHGFTTAGTSEFIVSSVGDENAIDYLIVGGGGASGNINRTQTSSTVGLLTSWYVGGGGAGAFRTNFGIIDNPFGLPAPGPLQVSPGTYPVVVGGSGGNSSCFGLTAAAGGKGGSCQINGSNQISAGQGGANGGSGGGGSAGPLFYSGGQPLDPTGRAEGDFNLGKGGGTGRQSLGAGGGGASEAGLGNNFTGTGAGRTSNITGADVLYAEGGHNVNLFTAGSGGRGVVSIANTAGAAGGNNPGRPGVVYIRYRIY